MSSVSIVTSRSNRARLDRAERWLHEKTHGQKAEVLVIGPSRRAADDFVRAACPIGQGTIGVHRATLLLLASEIAGPALANKTAAPLGALGSLALTTRAIHLALQDGTPLEYFEPVARMPGFARALSATLRELRLEDVGTAELGELGDAAGRDLLRLASAFEAELERARLKDSRDVLALAARAALEGAHRFASMPILFLDVSPSSKSEAALVSALGRRAPVVMATILDQDELGKSALENALGAPPEPIDPPFDPGAGGALTRARRFVFSLDEPLQAPGDASLEFFSAPGEGREAAEIARRLLACAAEGVPFDRMAVFLRDPDRYQPLVDEALRRARIPAFYTSGTVRPDPSGRALLALIACRGENLSASRFAEYLSLGQVPAADASGAPMTREVAWAPAGDEAQLVFKTEVAAVPPPEKSEEDEEESAEDADAPVVAGSLRAPFAWEQLLVEAAVIGKKERWARRLTGLAEELDAKIAALGAEAVREREHLERQRTRLGHLTAYALPIIDFLEALPERETWKFWLDKLLELAGMALRKTATIASVISELRPMEDVGPVTLDEVREVLVDRLTFLRAEPPNRRYGKVFVARLEEAAGRSFDVVFLPGLAEGILPKKKHEDPLLLDEKRKRLAAHVKVQAQRSAEERILLMLVLGSADRRLVASYPRMDVAEGRPRVPSFYALDLLRAAEGRLPHLRELEKRAESAADARLGWPAPRRPEAAIDVAEYDLAILEELLHQPAEQTRGAARYMILANECLARSLHARAARWRKRFESSDCFLAKDPATKPALEAIGLRSRSYGATDLERFAKCPYQFYLSSVLRLHPRDRAIPIEEIDPRMRGIIFHDVQHALFRALEAEGLLPVDRANLPKAIDRLAKVGAEVAARYEERLAPAIPKVYAREIESLMKDLRGHLSHAADHETDWRPLLAEQSFGEGTGLSILDGVRLHGRIDLVEEHVDSKVVRVTDYKTGRRPDLRLQHVGQGEYLQPLLYALAAERLFERPVVSGRLSFATAREEFSSIEIPLDEPARETIALAVHLIQDMIGAGFLPAAPKRNQCERCDHRAVCGPLEERRILQKDDQALGPLVRLRSLP